MLRLLSGSVLLLLVLAPGAQQSMQGQTSGPGTSGVASLKQSLENGLKARTPDEFAFIANVVDKVSTGVLPQSLVDTTFDYARRKPHPMQSFEFALRSRAKKAGIAL